MSSSSRRRPCGASDVETAGRLHNRAGLMDELGEGPDDLAPFEAEAFVDAILA